MNKVRGKGKKKRQETSKNRYTEREISETHDKSTYQRQEGPQKKVGE